MENFLYRDIAELEDQHWWHVAKRALIFDLLKAACKKPFAKVLDYGCGTGRNVSEWSRLGEAWGYDPAPEALKYCRERKIDRVTNSVEALRSQQFDVITLLDVLEHAEEAELLDNLQHCLKPEGLLIITVPAYSWLWSRWDEVLHHKRRYTRATLRACLEKHGFFLVTSSYMYSFLLLPVVVVRFIKNVFCRGQYSSDFALSSALMNTVGLWLCKLEKPFIERGLVPFGTSIVAQARKK